jgi:two-component system, response regulator
MKMAEESFVSEQVEVLLVDDSQADVKLTLHAIEYQNLPHRFRILRDGEEALNYLFSSTVATLKLILLDLKLPKVNGLEVLKAVKSDPNLRAVPVVILTSSGQESDIRSSYRLGANSYIQKPVDFDDFRAAVQQVRTYWLELNKVPATS